MLDKEYQSLTIRIAGRPYSLKIEEADVPLIRKIVDEVNEKINLFETTYTRRDRQDHLAMAIMSYAVDLHKTLQKQPNSADQSEQLSQIDAMLDEALTS